MPITASPVWEAWSDLSARFPTDLNLNDLARTTKAVQRRRGDGVDDGTTLLRLCLARGPGGKSLQETAAWAHLNGVAQLTAQSLNERLHRSVGFLAAITHRLLAGNRAVTPSLWAGRCLHIADGSSLSQPGSQGTDWRLHAVYDLSQNRFRHVEVTDTGGAESLLRCAPAEGEVLIADRGYARAKDLRACLDPSGPHAREFIVRVGWRALALRDKQGQPFDLIAYMQTLAADAGPQDCAVQAVVGSTSQPSLLPLRLIVVPLPADKAEINRKKFHRTASKHQHTLDPRSLIAAGFVVLVTSLPAAIPAEEIAAVYRLRWQVELAFKRLKSLLHIDRLPTRTTEGGLSWLYPHLILLLLTEDICQDFLASSP
jgi:hypothetical protein